MVDNQHESSGRSEGAVDQAGDRHEFLGTTQHQTSPIDPTTQVFVPPQNMPSTWVGRPPTYVGVSATLPSATPVETWPDELKP